MVLIFNWQIITLQCCVGFHCIMTQIIHNYIYAIHTAYLMWKQPSVQFSHSVVSNSLRPHESQHTRPPWPSPTPRVYSKLMSIESVISSSHLILYHPLLLLPSILPSIRVFSNESTLRMRWPKYWSFSFSTSPPNEYPGLFSFRMDWLDLLEVQETLKSLLQHHSSKASILWHSAFLTVQLSHPYMTTGKTIALTRWTFVGKVMSLLESNHRCYVNTGCGSNNISLAKIRRIHSIWSACQLLRRLMSEIL